MSDYISREEAKLAVVDVAQSCENGFKWGEAVTFTPSKIIGLLDKIPAADVRPVVRGKWKLRDGGVGVCSNCKSVLKDVWDYDSSDPFCSECGADMREVSTSEEPLYSEGTTRKEQEHNG